MAPSGLNEIQGVGSLPYNNQKAEWIIESFSSQVDESSGMSAAVNISLLSKLLNLLWNFLDFPSIPRSRAI